MKAYILGSGSDGNCTILENDSDAIMLDCGVPRLSKIEDIPWNKIRGICITHSHTDHTNKLKTALRRADVPVYITREEYFTDRFQKQFGGFIENPPLIKFVEPNLAFQVGSFTVLPIRACHDTPLPCHYFVQDEYNSFFYGSDTVDISMDAFNCMCIADFVMIESNYDEQVMKTDILDNEQIIYPYDSDLKYRIKYTAHMSNTRVRNILKRLPDNKPILLGHVSKNYNSKKTLKKVFRKMHNVIIRDRSDYPMRFDL